MEVTKWLALSKTFWGILASAAGVLAAQFNWTWWGAVSDDASQAVNLVIQLAGLVFAMYGRIKADTKVTMTP